MNSSRARNKTLFLVVLSAILVSACGSGSAKNKQTPIVTPPSASDWSLPLDFIFDGGPGRDGIPALDSPFFEPAATISTIKPEHLGIAVRVNGEVKIYPHDIMNWHEIVNDGPDDDPFTLSYCPLTGSAMAWRGTATHVDPSFGVSGLLFNSNLLLYDRETASVWSQMYESGVFGTRKDEVPKRLQVIEAKFGTLRDMFPDAMVMNRNTGHIRDYRDYPYNNYRTDTGIFFPVTFADLRMHPKARVIGIRDGEGVDETSNSKVYQLSEFGNTTQVINDQLLSKSIVVIGNTDLNFAVIYDRELADGTILNLSPFAGDPAHVATDDEGNVWDIFGMAVSGPRAGTQLGMTRSYTAYWFSWAAHFREPLIHFNVSGP